MRLLEGYRGYVMTDDYVDYNSLGAQALLFRLAFEKALAQQRVLLLEKTNPGPHLCKHLLMQFRIVRKVFRH